MKNPRYEPKLCGTCGQTEDYALPMDPGGALIVVAIANAVKRLGRNRVHLIREMEVIVPGEFRNIREAARAGFLNSRFIGNASRPRYHGLIAFADEGSGEYVITRKGAAFLHGMEIDRIAIIDKRTHHNAGYWPDGGKTTIHKLLVQYVKGESIWNLNETASHVERIGNMLSMDQLALPV